MYEQAIDELAALQDPRAVEALAQAVLPDAGLDADTRERAASALSQQVINSRFSDPVSVEPMQQLAKDRNEIVRGIAVNTLQEMQKYEKSRFSGHVKFY
ncbi:MAG: HEAT repeat domain-containing protein [Gammaproteobacteria bacterium]